MPFAILAILVIIAVVLMLGRTRKTNCDWKLTAGGHGSLREFECRTCGVTAYGQNGQPPRHCKRNIKTGTL